MIGAPINYYQVPHKAIHAARLYQFILLQVVKGSN